MTALPDSGFNRRMDASLATSAIKRRMLSLNDALTMVLATATAVNGAVAYMYL